MKKVIMIYDQIQAGAGTKDDKMIPLGAKKEAVGPAVMMGNFLKKNDEKVAACLYCGNGYYRENQEEVIRKLTVMVQKLNPDIVICGPAFNYADYADMAARTAFSIQKNTNITVVAAMSKENESVIAEFKDQIHIVETPKKGGTGLNQALENICILAKKMSDHEDCSELVHSVCFQ